MKFIFLDIDGVLNAESDICNPDGTSKKKAPRLHTTYGAVYTGIAQPRVARLKRIVDATGAKIVLVSSWKPYYMKYMRGQDDDHVGKYLVNALSRKKVRIFDTTLHAETRGDYNRGMGIVNWLHDWAERHPDEPVEGIVILDDEIFDYRWTGLMSYLCQSDYYAPAGKSGLTDEIADRAIDVLNGSVPFDMKKLLDPEKDPS